MEPSSYDFTKKKKKTPPSYEIEPKTRAQAPNLLFHSQSPHVAKPPKINFPVSINCSLWFPQKFANKIPTDPI